MDGPATPPCLSVGYDTTLPFARSGSYLWHRLHQTGRGDGHPGSAVGATISLAAGLCGARDRNDSARVLGPRDCLQRSLSAPAFEVVRDVLSRIQNAPLAG